jgi:hypothetical protein
MLLWLLFSSVVISTTRDFPMLLLLNVKMENLFLLLPCLAQKTFVPSSTALSCTNLLQWLDVENDRLFSSNVVLIPVFCFGVAAA